MANMYRSVLASGGASPTGDAVAADVLTGKTFSNAQATGISGTMPNNGAVSGVATPSQPYTIPAGYHNGSGTVTATSAPPASVINLEVPYNVYNNGAFSVYTFGVHTLKVTPESAYVTLNVYSDAAHTNLIDSAAGSAKNIDVSNYDVVYIVNVGSVGTNFVAKTTIID